jgi:hypothetical protein
MVEGVSSKIPDIRAEDTRGPPPERIYTEQHVLQEEAILHMPPLASILLEKQYNLSNVIKILVGAGTIFVLWYFLGLDAVIIGIVSFFIFIAFGYFTQMRNIEKDATYFFESRKSGQIIDPKRPGVPQYSRRFMVSFDRTAAWTVPNTLIRKGLFKIPGEPVDPLPGSGKWYFVDLFDEINSTCVLPQTPDVANICLDANMNGSLAQQFDFQKDIVENTQSIERHILNQWEYNVINTDEAKKRLATTQARQNAIIGSAGLNRDIFFVLQDQIPTLQNMLRVTRNSIISLAYSFAAEFIYEIIHEPMPTNIKANINEIRKRLNAPGVGQIKTKQFWE